MAVFGVIDMGVGSAPEKRSLIVGARLALAGAEAVENAVDMGTAAGGKGTGLESAAVVSVTVVAPAVDAAFAGTLDAAVPVVGAAAFVARLAAALASAAPAVVAAVRDAVVRVFAVAFVFADPFSVAAVALVVADIADVVFAGSAAATAVANATAAAD